VSSTGSALGRKTLPNEKRGDKTLRLRRVEFTIAYDGTGFSGWQSQIDGNAIQDHLERALARVTGSKVRLHGAGRTDAVVHALGQCAHADLSSQLPAERLRAALNASLPPAIRISRCRFVGRSFHARFSATGKVYRYRIATGPILSPFEIGRAWHVSGPLDADTLRRAADAFLGRHDFAGFAANRGKSIESTMRTIRRVQMRISRGIVTLEFEGDGFLYKMVRLMAGAIVDCARGKTTVEEIRDCLRAGKPPAHRIVAPAHGLTLRAVRYGSNC